MWTVVYIARNRALAERIKEELEREGMMVLLKVLGSEDKEGSVQVLVPEAEIEEAQELLTSIVSQ